MWVRAECAVKSVPRTKSSVPASKVAVHGSSLPFMLDSYCHQCCFPVDIALLLLLDAPPGPWLPLCAPTLQNLSLCSFVGFLWYSLDATNVGQHLLMLMAASPSLATSLLALQDTGLSEKQTCAPFAALVLSPLLPFFPLPLQS